jgi:hypothetical protein
VRKERNRQARERRQNGNTDDDERPGTNPFSTQTPLKIPATERDAADATEQAAASSTDSTGAPGTEILICSNCNEELPAGFVSGDACPHCGKVATYEVEESNPFAAGGGASAAPQNPFAAPGGVPPTAAMPAVMPAAPPPAAAAPAGGQGMSMADIPLIGKLGIFAGFVIVGWLILQRRDRLASAEPSATGPHRAAPSLADLAHIGRTILISLRRSPALSSGLATFSPLGVHSPLGRTLRGEGR